MQVVHETIIKDIIDILSDLKDTKALDELIKRNKQGNGIRSIAQASSNLHLNYPILVSDSISIEAAAMVSKAMERKNAQMIQLLLGAWQSKKLTGNEEFNPIEYLKQFHSNLNIDYNVSVDSILDTVDKVVKLTESMGLEDSRLKNIRESDIIEYAKENKIRDNELPDMIKESSVSSYRVSKTNTYGSLQVFQERTSLSDRYNADADDDDLRTQQFSNNTNREYRDNERQIFLRNKEARDQGEHIWKGNKERRDQNQEIRNQNKEGREQNQEIRNQNKEGREQDEHKWKQNDEMRKQGRDMRDQLKFDSDMRNDAIKSLNNYQQTMQNRLPQLQNVDVKKANELVGSPIMVTVHIAHDNGQIDPISFIIVVKSKMYPLSSKDIIQRVITKNKDKNFFGKLVKVATGEISFVRDFLLAIDQAKLDSLSQSRKGSSSKLWRVLERMALKSKFSRTIGKQNGYMAISTLVMSQEEVEYIKRYANMDMGKEGIARVIIDAYNLLCLVIVDETNETAKFLFNADQELFEELSFNQLEREASDGSYKKMVNLISKMK